MSAIGVLIWNEGVHEATQQPPSIGDYYPRGIHGAISDLLSARLPDAQISTATLADDQCGLAEAVLEKTDVLVWWGHIAHEQVPHDIVQRVQTHVLGGMGLIVLHSGHHSRLFRSLMGTTCNLQWRNAGERELVWTVTPSHPIARGIPSPLVIPKQEMYGEHFDIPRPDDVVFISSFDGGEVFRSGVTFTRGNGRIFYFSPGDQDYPVFLQAEIGDVIANAVAWAAPDTTARRLPPVINPAAGWYDTA